MKRVNLKHLFLVLVALLSIVGTEAKSYRVRDVQNVQRVDARRFVTNPDGILSRDAVATLDSICYALKARGIAEVAIVVVDDIRPRDMVSFSQDLFEGWGVAMISSTMALVFCLLAICARYASIRAMAWRVRCLMLSAIVFSRIIWCPTSVVATTPRVWLQVCALWIRCCRVRSCLVPCRRMICRGYSLH